MKYLLICSLFFLVTCSKQEPEKLEADYPVKDSSAQRAQACQETDFGKDILSHTNVKNLFVCMTWDKDFPHLYKSVSSIQSESWDLFLGPLNEQILNNKSKKNQLFSILKGLHEKNGLDELSKVIGVLSRDNFFDSSAKFFNCYLNKDLKECEDRAVIEEAQMKALISTLDLTTKDLDNLSFLLGKLSQMIAKHYETFNDPWVKVLQDEQFKNLRLLLADVFMLKLEDGIKPEEVKFLKNLFLLKTKNEKEPWILNYIQKQMNKNEFVYLLEFPLKESPTLVNDVKALLEARSKNVVCEYEHDGNRFEIEIEEKVEKFNNALAGKSQSVFYNTILNTISEIYIASEFCPGLKSMGVRVQDYVTQRKIAHNLNFFDVLTKSSSLLSKSKYYDLVQFIHLANIDEFENDRFHLLHKLVDDTTVGAIELSNEVGRVAPELYNVLYDMSQDIDPDFFSSIQTLTFWILDKDPRELQDLAIVWSFFNSQEKTFLVNFLDEHFLKDADVVLLLNFYNKLFDFFKPDYPVIYGQVASHGTETISRALADISNNLRGEQTRAEFIDFFGDKHLLKIIDVLMDGFQALPGNDLILSDLTLPLNEISNSELNYVELPESVLQSNEAYRCVSTLTNKFENFYEILDAPPGDCGAFREANVTIDLFYNLAEFQNDYRKEFGLGRYSRIFDEYGLTSPGILNASIYLSKYSENIYNDLFEQTDGLEGMINDLSSFLETKSNQDTIYHFLKSLYFFMGEESSISRNSLLHFVSEDENFDRLRTIIPYGVSLLDEYVSWQDESPRRDYETRFPEVQEAEFHCANFSNQDIGGFACPNSHELGIVLSRILKRLVTTYGKSPTALRQLAKAISVSHGLDVPFESKKARRSVMSLREILWSFYDLTDKNYEINKLKIPYLRTPKADAKFLEDDYMVITDDLEGGGGREPVLREMTTLERVETVVREVRFDYNTFGAHFINGVARAESYDDKVKERRHQLNLCADAVKYIPTCGKHVNGAEKRMIRNAKKTFKGLQDINIENGWRYGRFMQILETAMLSSSRKKAQKSSVLDLNSKEELKDHNGQILTLISMVNGFTNSARFFKDRLGNSREDFAAFVNSREFTQVEGNLLRGIEIDTIEPILIDFIQDFLLYNESHKGKPLERLISYLDELDYRSLRRLEATIAKVIYLSSFVGDLKVGGLLGLSADQLNSYGTLSVTPVVKFLNGLVGKMDRLDLFLTKYPASKWLDWLDRHVDFFYDFSHEKPKAAFVLVNEGMRLLDALSDVPGKDSLVAFLIDQEPEKIDQNITHLQNFWDMIRPGSKGESFYRFARTTTLRVVDDAKVNLQMFKNFLRITSEPQACSRLNQGEMRCSKNSQYDVTFRILSMWLEDEGKRFYDIIQELFFDRKDQILEFIRTTFSCIKLSP